MIQKLQIQQETSLKILEPNKLHVCQEHQDASKSTFDCLL